MDAAAELGRNPVSEHHIQPEYGDEQADAGRDCRTVSRDQILRRERGQRNIYFPCLADHVQNWQPYPLDPCSCYMCGHTSTTVFVLWCVCLFTLFLFLFLWRRRFYYSILVPLPFPLCMESTSDVFPSGWCFFHLGTAGWIFYTSSCDNSINPIKHYYQTLLSRR